VRRAETKAICAYRYQLACSRRKRAHSGSLQAQLSHGAKGSGRAGGNIRGKRNGVLGLIFKPTTDDMREAPSISLITALLDLGATVRAYDPVGMDDALVIVTEWEQFRALDLPKLKALMRQSVLIDLRNIYRADEMNELGFRYESVGRAGIGRSI
jgi:UDPglucose 6-dehydrogenase